MTHEERQPRICEMSDRLAKWLTEHWPESGADINVLEDFAERMGQELHRQFIERTLPEEAERKVESVGVRSPVVSTTGSSASK